MAMPGLTISQLKPSQLVRVSQTVDTREGPWETQVEGRVLSCTPEPTGSWYAHGKADRLWFQRLRIQKADGEITDVILDERSVVRGFPDEKP
jgi:hypothetical protein